MATRILGPTGSRRRRRFSLVSLLLVACTALFLAGSAQAVHDLEFQLDGNALANVCGTTPDGGPSGANACTVQKFDWGRPSSGPGSSNPNYIFNADRSVNTNVVKDTNVLGFTAAAFQRDFGLKVSAADNCNLTSTDTTKPFCTADTTTYATGSKDVQNISGGGADQAGNWQCNKDNNVTNKGDIMNAYSAAYKASNGHQLMYFALEKNTENGSNNAAFWFLQDGTVDCSSPGGGAVNFTGNHRNGDILVTSAYTNGGGVSSILAFRWAGGANGCIDSDPTVAPACDQQPIASGGDCKTAPSTPPPPHPVDVLCGTTNSGTLPTNGNITVPWLTVNGSTVGNTIVPPDFFEGAIDLTRAFAEAPGGASTPGCFNTFIADTRSSPSATATLYDYARGQLGQCKTTLTTQENKAASSSIGTGTVSSGTDTANLTVTGVNTWGGTLSWYLCGPLTTIPPTGPKCDSTKGLLVTSKTVNQSSSGSDFVSGTASITEVGDYCWTAHFEPNQASKDAGVSAANDTGANECFTITPVTPAVGTASVQPLELLAPTVYGGLADLNGDGSGSSDPTADNSAAFYGDTSIIGGKLDCNNWASTNDGAAGDGQINPADHCTLLGYDGSASGVTINVVDGSFQVPDGTVLPAIFPDPLTPTDSSIVNAKFAWSSQYGKVDSNGNGSIGGTDCSFGIIGNANILGNDASCGAPYTSNPNALNGMVDLNNDGKITAAGDSCSTGCFLGHKVSSGFVVTGPVAFGQTIYDAAVLTGTATQKATNGIDSNYLSIICNGNAGAPALTPNACTAAATGNGATTGGKISFTLRGPGSAPPCPAITNNSTAGDTNPQDVTPISLGVDGTYGPVHYTPGAPGTYYWQAQYFAATGPPADANNNNSALHNANCDVSGETVVVQQIPTQISTTQKVIPQDSATITSSASGDNIPAGGTVTFFLYAGDTAANNLTNCQAHGGTVGSGGLVYKEPFSTDTTPKHSETFNSNNTIAVTANTTVYWRVTYATGDSAHTGRQSDCAESTATTFVNDSGPGTLFP